MITNFHMFESNIFKDRFRIRTKGLDIEENDYILFRLRIPLNFYGWDYRTGELYIGHLYNIKIRPELHFNTTTEIDNDINKLVKSPKEIYDNLYKNKLTNMQFKLMLRQMIILEKGTLQDIIEKLKELKNIEKYNL